MSIFYGLSRRVRVAGLALLILVLLLASFGSANAVRFGVVDTEHDYVGLLVFDVNGSPAWRCSGTLLSPTVLLTAGHCTFGATGGRVWFDTDVTSANNSEYPFGGSTSVEFAEIHTHPQYDDNAFFLHDAGIVILSEPVAASTYGVLPSEGYLDQFLTRRGLQNQVFNPVGYGLQSVKPVLSQDRIRYSGEVHVIGSSTFGMPDGTALSYTVTPGKAHSGGTCFGDSGGPLFAAVGSNLVVGVTSFALNSNCAGTGGAYRIDQADDLAFINSFLN